MNLKSLKYFFFLMMAVITLSSCSEDDATTDEYANKRVSLLMSFLALEGEPSHRN